MASNIDNNDGANGESKDDEDLGSRKRWKNPIKVYLARKAHRKLEREQALLLREEKMNEDLERYLMQIEEHRCWVAFQLGHLNFERMKKRQVINKLTKRENERSAKEQEEWEKENGLSYFLGSVESYKKWQNSPAKYLDYTGHIGAVTTTKFSPCMQYMLSCSEDKTIRLWSIETGECIKTLTGHTKVVNDADFHTDFKMFRRHAGIISCSGDNTLKVWNGSDTNALSTLYGHTSAVYRVAFSPDCKTIVSCSEDRTVRTWCFPEGYCLFVYKGHSSGVTALRFSASGRYIASGSDYGERKILLWSAKMPDFHSPEQFPHIFFWTPEGLIKKIVIRKAVPKLSFWLQQTQMRLINDDDSFDVWPGEVSDIEEDEDDESDTENDDHCDIDSVFSKGKEEDYMKDDVRELKGITLKVTHVSAGGEQTEATEYNPGGFLVVTVQVWLFLSCSLSAH
ncbi:hypothetical protein EON65_38525 [archaeon]|nr:MAG: hypothetical protein EON65_38525 [archaeon]